MEAPVSHPPDELPSVAGGSAGESSGGPVRRCGRAGTGEAECADFPYGDLKLTPTTKFGAAPETLAVAE